MEGKEIAYGIHKIVTTDYCHPNDEGMKRLLKLNQEILDTLIGNVYNPNSKIELPFIASRFVFTGSILQWDAISNFMRTVPRITSEYVVYGYYVHSNLITPEQPKKVETWRDRSPLL